MTIQKICTCLTQYSWSTFESSKDIFVLIAEFIFFKRENSSAFSKMNHNNSFDRNFFSLNEKNGSSFVTGFSKKEHPYKYLNVYPKQIPFYLWFLSTYFRSELFMGTQMWALPHINSYWIRKQYWAFWCKEESVIWSAS